MKLLRSLFGSAAAPTKGVIPSLETVRPARDPTRMISIRLEAAQLVLRCGSETVVQAEGPISLETTPDRVLVTNLTQVHGPPPMCDLEVPEGATVDVQLVNGGLTVRNFRGTLRARILSGDVSVEKSEGTFHVVAPDGHVEFDRVHGEIDILTHNGAVTARQIQGGLRAVSSGGAMEFEDVDGPIAARTLSGTISASDMNGTARLSTRTGAVRITGACGQLKVRTQSGEIALDCSIVAHTTLETFKGNLDIRLGPQTDTRLEATVGQGVVRAERISPLPGSSRRTLRSTVGLGQSRLRLASGLGVISVAGPPRVPRPLRQQAAHQVAATSMQRRS